MKGDTQLVRAGRRPEDYGGVVNPPVYHASTVLFEEVDVFRRASGTDGKMLTYGRYGTPTTFCLADAVAAIEGGYRSALFPSGLAAISSVLVAFLAPGDHLLMPNSAYAPARRAADRLLRRLGVTTTYYDPTIGVAIADLVRPNTRVIYTESPGSLTFEVQDIPAVADVASRRNAIVVMDNTWATPLYFKPFEHGVDVSIQAATKYIAGHSDAMMGVATATAAAWAAIQDTAIDLGQCVGPDDAYLVQRGIRTMSVRLRQQQENAIALASWLRARPEVERVLYPALPDDPGHKLWRRDFLGASGLFGVLLKPNLSAMADAFIESLELFGLGASWGGYESLIMPANIRTRPMPPPWDENATLLRIHAGLEDVDDLVRDLEQAFARLRAAA